MNLIGLRAVRYEDKHAWLTAVLDVLEDKVVSDKLAAARRELGDEAEVDGFNGGDADEPDLSFDSAPLPDTRQLYALLGGDIKSKATRSCTSALKRSRSIGCG